MKRVSLAVVLVIVPILALAEPKTAAEWFNEGDTQYNLGNFDKAADAFKQAFALETDDSKKAVYLYNVGQAYRQGKKCSDAVFFYKRFLALKANDTKKPLTDKQRADTEKFIADLEECVKQQDAAKNRPPDETLGHEGSGSSAGSNVGAGSGSGSAKKPRVGDGSGEDGDDGEGSDKVTKKTKTAGAKLVSARLEGGVSTFSAGSSGSLKWPAQGTGTVIAGYPLHLQPKLELDLGAAVTVTPIAYTSELNGASGTATFTQVLANAGAAYDVIPKLAVRGDLGLGAASFNGIQQMGSPFTKNGVGTSGALGMFALRLGLSADYAITPNLFATATPFALSFSPASSGLVFSSLVRLDFMVGVGYRM